MHYGVSNVCKFNNSHDVFPDCKIKMVETNFEGRNALKPEDFTRRHGLLENNTVKNCLITEENKGIRMIRTIMCCQKDSQRLEVTLNVHLSLIVMPCVSVSFSNSLSFLPVGRK